MAAFQASLALAHRSAPMSSADQPGSAGVEPGQDFVGLLAQDVRVIERPAEFEEGEIERDRDRDQQNSAGNLSAHRQS